ncbi:MAG TPA: glycoside hydrolase family 52 protein [Solirubrobacteraceae bacterium]|nr:glycoside hydrolase family 52 protein [Solirubrobacteraceae bacterium]
MTVFNAHHAPIGAYATFTLGGAGRTGGLRSGSGHPPCQDVLVGARDAGGTPAALPFFAAATGDGLRAVPLHHVRRDFRLTSDTFAADGVALRIRSPLGAVPEPEVAAADDLRDGLLPAVLVELTIDNTDGAVARRGFLGVRPGAPVRAGGREPASFVIAGAAGGRAGVFCAGAGVSAAAGAEARAVVDGPAGGAGDVGALRFDVPPGARAEHRLVVVFWHGGTVAAGPGIACSYWYTELFEGLDDVARHALDGFDRLVARWDAAAEQVEAAGLSDDQRLQLAHAVHSYYGNTALLRTADGRPVWAVMEGEFEFIDTLDLTVDHAFFELRQSPWTVRNVLDVFLERAAYRDRHGLSFGHDLGCFPAFAAPGASAYEQPRRPGRTVLMTSEELTNWTLTALLYVAQTGDEAWAAGRSDTLAECLAAIVARDAGAGGERDGLVGAETDRTGPYGEEITTFDSLDPSLRRARRSGYLAAKQWAACAALAAFFDARGDEDLAATAREQAGIGAARLVAAVAEHGYVPGRPAADGEPADLAQGLPVLECLALALYAGAAPALAADGEHAALVDALARHLRSVLRPGACLFADGGWKLSSAHDNSWLSKVYLCQFVARRILGLPWDAAGRRADAAHAAWLTGPDDTAWAFSDQILAGRIHSSRYYPRGVTAALWLEERPRTARLDPPPGA